MGLSYQIDSIDGLSEEVAEMYVEKDGKFILDISGLPKPEPVEPAKSDDTTGLKSALKKEREARKALEKQAKTYEGIDPDKYTEMTERITELKAQEDATVRKEAERKGQWEKLEQDLNANNVKKLEAVKTAQSQEVSTLSSRIEELNLALETEVGEKALISAISKADGNTTILMPHVKNQVKVIKLDSGQYAPVVVDSSGEARYDEAGTPMTPDALIEEIRKKPEFQGEGIFKTKTKPGGSDSEGGQGGSSTPNNPFKKDSLNLTEQAMLTKNDPQKAAKLKQEAGIS